MDADFPIRKRPFLTRRSDFNAVAISCSIEDLRIGSQGPVCHGPEYALEASEGVWLPASNNVNHSKNVHYAHAPFIYMHRIMNLGDIMAFVALAETGSINRAALRLGLTQPATSRRVQNFEASLGGAQLLDRSVKPPVLTPAGRQALAHCQRVLKAVAELEAGAADSREPAGDLRIGVSPGLAEAVLSAPLDDLRNRYPDLQLRISTQWTTPLIHAVRDSELDCAIALVTEDHTLPAGVVSVVLGSEPLAVVAPRDAHFTNRKNRRALCLGDLSQYGWVLNPAGCGYREALVRAMDRAQAPFRLVAEVLGYDLQLSLIAKGAGIGLVPARLIDKNRKRGQLDVLNVTDFSLEVQVAMLRGAWLGSLGVAVDYLQSRFTAVRYKKSA